MKSTIRVDFKGLNGKDGFEPVIRVNLQDSEDVRDGLLKAFFQKLGYNSNWLCVDIQTSIIDGNKQPTQYTITPIEDNELEETVSIIKERLHAKPEEPIFFQGGKHYGSKWPVTFSDEDGVSVKVYSQAHIDDLGLRD